MESRDTKLISVGDVLALPVGRSLVSTKLRNDVLEDDERFPPSECDPLFYEGVKIVMIQTIETEHGGLILIQRIAKFAEPTLLRHHLFRLEQFELVA